MYSDIRRFCGGVAGCVSWMRGDDACVVPDADAMRAVEIAPETQKHPFAVMLLLGCKAAPIVAYV